MQEQPAGRKVPGPPPLTRQRQEFARLIARGVSNAEACRLVGVNRRTGTRWRVRAHGPQRAGGEREYPAMIKVTKDSRRGRRGTCPRPSGGRSLTGAGPARACGRSRVSWAADVSSVSRELGRNRDDARPVPAVRGAADGDRAAGSAEAAEGGGRPVAAARWCRAGWT